MPTSTAEHSPDQQWPSSDKPGGVGHDEPTRDRLVLGEGLEDIDARKLLQLTDSKLSGKQFGLLGFGLCLGMFLAILDTSIVATSLFAIANDLGYLETVNWVALSYTLTLLGFAVLLTQLADLFGRWWCFMASCMIFFCASLACGFAANMTQLIAFRAIQGIGGSGLTSLTLVIFPEVAPMRHAHLIGGLCGLVVAGAGILGPILGGVFASLATWRWIFWINAPIVFIAAVIFCLAWPKPDQIIEPEKKHWTEMDYIGSFLLVGAAVLTVFAFQNAATDPQQWSRAVFLAPFIFGLALWTAFGAWEWWLERRYGNGKVGAVVPTWPASLLANRVFAGAALCTALTGFTFFMVIFALPLRFQIVNAQSALMAGVLLLPLLGATAVGSAFGSGANAAENRLFETILTGCCLSLLGCGLLTTLSSSQSVEAKAVGFEVFVGLGNGLVAAGVTTLAALESSIRDQAVAQGIIAQARVLGGSLGIAASSAILSRKVDAAGSAQLGGLLHGGTASEDTTEEMHRLSGEIYTSAFTEDMYVGLAMAVLGAICSFAIYRRRKLTILELRNVKIVEEIRRRRDKYDPYEMMA